jgi:hypothetical protein
MCEIGIMTEHLQKVKAEPVHCQLSFNQDQRALIYIFKFFQNISFTVLLFLEVLRGDDEQFELV